MLYILLIICAFLGCDLACNQKDSRQPPFSQKVARVYNTYLLKEDLAGLVPPNTNEKDSLAFLDQYIQTWLTKYLIAHQSEKMTVQEAAVINTIEKKVADFRASLLLQHYLDRAVETKLDKVISVEEIAQYYLEHQSSFKLSQPIIKGKFVILPKQTPPTTAIRAWLISEKKEDLEALEEYCKKFAKDYSLDNTLWLRWNALVTQTPLIHLPDKQRLLKINTFTEVHDADYKYYLRIDAYKAINEVPPLCFISKEIAQIILYKRTLVLIEQLKKDILKQAKPNHDYTIYTQK